MLKIRLLHGKNLTSIQAFELWLTSAVQASAGPRGLIFDCLLYLHPRNERSVHAKEQKQTVFVMSQASASEFHYGA